MATLPDVGLGSAKVRIAVVAMLRRLLRPRRRLVARDIVRFLRRPLVPKAAVVTGHDDEGVFGHARFVQRGEDCADAVIRFHHEVAIQSRATLAQEQFVGCHGQVRRIQRQVQEKRFRRICGLLFNEFHRARLEGRQHALQREIRRLHPRHSVTENRVPVFRRLLVRHANRLSAVDEAVGRHVERGRDAKILIEPAVQRLASDRALKIDVGSRTKTHAGSAHTHRLAFPIEPLHAQMPLADACGCVALRFEERRDRRLIRLNQRRTESIEHALVQPRPPTVAARHQSVTRRRAHTRGRVCIRKAHALLGNPIHVRRRDLGLRVVALGISPAHVVRQNQDDVGR